MFVPKKAPKEPSETVRIPFPASTMRVLREIAGETKSEVREIVRQAVDYALSSRLSPAPKHRGRKPAATVDQPETEK